MEGERIREVLRQYPEAAREVNKVFARWTICLMFANERRKMRQKLMERTRVERVAAMKLQLDAKETSLTQ